jgi:hypothetical protein
VRQFHYSRKALIRHLSAAMKIVVWKSRDKDGERANKSASRGRRRNGSRSCLRKPFGAYRAAFIARTNCLMCAGSFRHWPNYGINIARTRRKGAPVVRSDLAWAAKVAQLMRESHFALRGPWTKGLLYARINMQRDILPPPPRPPAPAVCAIRDNR